MRIVGWLFLILVGFGVYGLVANPKLPSGSSGTVVEARKVATIDKSAEMQADRKAFIEKAIANGAFQKIEIPGSLPRLWVKPGFYTLDFDDKASFVSVVYAYYFDGSNSRDVVRIFDSKSGKSIGAYSDLGLNLD